MRTCRTALGLLLGPALLLLAAAPGGAGPGQAITPGVQMVTEGSLCTGNFVFRDRAGHTYVGYAAHCAGRGEPTDIDGCSTRSWRLGTPVRFVEGASVATGGTTLGQGTLAYSSWRTMRRLRTPDADLCTANDFALVRVDAGDAPRVDATVPFWGGPTGLARGAGTGDQVHSYGSSSLRAGLEPLSPKTGAVVSRTYGGWSLDVYTVTPGVPGDSGSGFLDAEGRALGTLSTVQVAPLVGSNGVSHLRRQLRFAREHSGIAGLRLVKGGEFTGLP